MIQNGVSLIESNYVKNETNVDQRMRQLVSKTFKKISIYLFKMNSSQPAEMKMNYSVLCGILPQGTIPLNRENGEEG